MVTDQHNYQTQGGISVTRIEKQLTYLDGIDQLVDQLNRYRGALFTSSFEYPQRYTRWDIGFVNPPLVFTTQGLSFSLQALNRRGEVLLAIIRPTLEALTVVTQVVYENNCITGKIIQSTKRFAEEARSKQPSIFSVLHVLIEHFKSDEDHTLGFFGAFGYDLLFQFEHLKQRLVRDPQQLDCVLYLPDDITLVDHRKEQAWVYQYDFVFEQLSTTGLKRTGERHDFKGGAQVECPSDHEVGEYANIVRLAHDAFRKGDLFEVVCSQTFFESCQAKPAQLFKTLRTRNPAPYGSLINLGHNEYLIGASPEMYVRVTGNRVETCPISGTIARGRDAIGDAEQILTLLNSKKDTAELTMCTDVDRNDKSRICEPGSVQVIGRKLIEMYSRLIHTVDHVEGILRQDYDALDAFLTHAWVVTVTGAPKVWAAQFIEDHEKSVRGWYGGAVGMLKFNGDINTGLTIRTIVVKDGVASVRVGATLLYDSDPEMEEAETRLKASALLDAIRSPEQRVTEQKRSSQPLTDGRGKHILLIDHQDSFVHTLANYLRQTGAEVSTYRAGLEEAVIQDLSADLVVLSPGPGCPKDFNLKQTIDNAIKHNIPIFGVCLGLQGLVEYFGGELGVLDYPMHGKPTQITTIDGKLFTGLPKTFTAARYHSLFAKPDKLPEVFKVTAQSEDGVIMAIEHKTLPISAVQFHPESILTLKDQAGLKIIINVIRNLLNDS